MPSLWLIDGYNFIRQSRRFSEWETREPEAARRAALEWLGDFARLSGEQLWVIFDAYNSLNRGMEESQVFGLKVFQSRGAYTADEEIVALCQRYGEAAIAVSSDRAIQRDAIRAKASILNSEEFEREVARALQKTPDPESRAFRSAPPKPPREKAKAYRILRKYQS